MIAHRFARWSAPLTVLGTVLLAGCGVSHSEYDSLQAQNQSLQAQNKQLEAELNASKEHVGRLQNAIKYVVNSDLLFRSGSWTISPRGKEIMARFASKLAQHQQQMLLVNAYTDNVPIGAKLKQKGVSTNLELSQKRADAVMHFLVFQGLNAKMVSAHGYGAANPVASNDTAQGRARNRRVELELEPA